MRLKQWVELKGRGELMRLARETGIHYTTVFELAKDHRCAEYPTAVAISKATSGAVSIAELCDLPPKAKLSAKARSSKRKRARARRAPTSAVSAAPAARA